MKASIAVGQIVLLMLASTAVAGGTVTPAPEPGTFELLALGGVVALVIGIRNRNRRKK